MTIKNEEELEGLKAAGHAVAITLKKMKAFAKVGMRGPRNASGPYPDDQNRRGSDDTVDHWGNRYPNGNAVRYWSGLSTVRECASEKLEPDH